MDPELLDAMTVGRSANPSASDTGWNSIPSYFLRGTGLLAAWLLAVLAVSGPTWRPEPSPFADDPVPVMLLGGSKTDHVFLLDDLEAHLDEIATVGGDYVRCTMSQREGLDLKPHRLLADGKFDLDQWNDEYWKRFANCLKWRQERGIIIQIEFWDRFDYSTQNWETSPWNPKNNVNYTYEQTSFAREYPQHSARDLQPFFHSIEGMPRHDKKLDLIRTHQEAFVAKMLSYSLDYGHVLYCMDNETSTPAQWEQYWIQFINGLNDFAKGSIRAGSHR
jgi:hypothetical protein